VAEADIALGTFLVLESNPSEGRRLTRQAMPLGDRYRVRSGPLISPEGYHSGDHLHPRAIGYKAIAEAIDLTLLQRSRRQAIE
jgi:hypothetical protein